LIKADETKTSSKVGMRDQDINLLQSVWRRFLYTDHLSSEHATCSHKIVTC